MEIDKIGPESPSHHTTARPGLHSDAIATYLTAAREAVSRVLATSGAEGDDEDRIRARAVESKGRPALVIMSDDPDAWETFEQDERAGDFRVVGTPRASPADQQLKDAGGFVRRPQLLSVTLGKP